MDFKEKVLAVVEEYHKSIIQSEAEVRSKLIVPLLGVLGYPSELRAEEFPVYGFEGGKKLPVKNADYIMFSELDFANYREYKHKNIEWVQNHSLLVVEAKKPGEMPEFFGQPQYYTIWTKSVAYLMIDGNQVCGYYYNTIISDYKIIECKIEELPYVEELDMFSYNNVLTLKNQHLNIVSNVEYEDAVNLDDVVNISEDMFDYIRNALGKNSIGLDEIQLTNTFFNTTNMYLKCDMRYDIPEYMLDIPRNSIAASVYLNNIVLPYTSGELVTFYWEEYVRYVFTNDFIDICVIYKNDKLLNYEIGYHILDSRVEERLKKFEYLNRCIMAENILINSGGLIISLPLKNQKKQWIKKKSTLILVEYWVKELKKMKEIEEYYEIKFLLEKVGGIEETNKLYSSVDFVYDGMVMNYNCDITLPGGFEKSNFRIYKPIVFEENGTIPLQDRVIHGVVFRPYRSVILPGKIRVRGTTENDTIKVKGCCLYKIIPDIMNVV